MDLALSVVLLEENLAFPELSEEHLKATECCSINVSMMVIFTRSQNMCRVTDKKNNVTELFFNLSTMSTRKQPKLTHRSSSTITHQHVFPGVRKYNVPRLTHQYEFSCT